RAGRVLGQSSLGAFDPVARDLIARSGGGPAMDMSFLGPIFEGALGDLSGGIPRSRNFQSSLGALPSAIGPSISANAPGSIAGLEGLGSIFASALPIANADPFSLGASVTENLRAQALPGQQRAVNSAMDRLFASGRLGTTGGAQQMEALANAQNQQDLQFQLAGLEAGRALQSDALARAMGAFGGQESMASRLFGEALAGEQLRTSTALGAEQLAQSRMFGVESAAQGRDQLAMANLSRLFGEGLSAAGMRGQFAIERAGLGTSLANTLLQNLVMGHNIGMSNLQGAVGLAQLPLAFQNAALAAEAQRSGGEFNDAINAAGQFVEPIKSPGTGGSG